MAGPGDSGRSQATAAPKFCRFHSVAEEQKDTLRQSSHQGNGRCVLPRIPPGSVPGSINTISQKSWTGLWLPHHFREDLDEAQDRTLGRVALLRTVPTTLLLSHNQSPKILFDFIHVSMAMQVPISQRVTMVTSLGSVHTAKPGCSLAGKIGLQGVR